MPEGYDAFPRRAAERYDRRCAHRSATRSRRWRRSSAARTPTSRSPTSRSPRSSTRRQLPAATGPRSSAARPDARTRTRCSTTWSAAAPRASSSAACSRTRWSASSRRTSRSTPIAFHGVAQAGATNTTVNSLSNAHELAFQLRNAHARFLITIPQFLDRALPAAAEAGIDEVFVFGEARGRDAVRLVARNRRAGAATRDRRRDPPRVAAVLQRDHRATQGRDARRTGTSSRT